ncbi:MAG TPA: HAD family hydrolase [Acidimicrobiales bacterium]|nr:HAD family hydrolase [Acidimicrobiales bacterium]
MIDVVALDGDDTLWHSENQFVMTQDRFKELLAGRADPDLLDARLMAHERENLQVFGYGVKGFTLSMIETAIEVTEGRIDTADIQAIIDGAKEMLQHPVELLDGVAETVRALVKDYRVMVITKGDLFHQESKLARSGLVEDLWQVEIVAEKDEASYRRIFDRYGLDPATFVMVGNSVKSDILPVLALGGRAVHIEYEMTWEMEHAEADKAHEGYWELDTIRDLPTLLATL